MAEPITGRRAVVPALVVAGTLLGAGLGPAAADVTAVKGEAFGYRASVSLFGGPPMTRGPEPIVTLAPDASNSPQQASIAQGLVQFGPATLFSTDQITVNTQGSTGPTGSVTSSTSLTNINRSGQEIFTASSASSTCTATQAGVSGSTSINGGTLQTSQTGGPGGTPVFVNVLANPAPNTTINGVIEAVGDSFQYIFNEQIRNQDGSITVYAGHLRLLGPTAVGDLYWGKSECGVTPPTTTTTTSTSTTSTSTTSTTTTSTTTTTTPPSTTTTTPPPDTTTTTTGGGEGGGTVTTVTEVGGGAYGYLVSISLFGGPVATRGPAPTVTLPAGGSASPITASEPSSDARFGPAIIFSSGPLEVSTQGTTGAGGSVTSSARISNANQSGQERFTAGSISSTCTASESGVTGSTSISGGRLITSEVNPDIDEDDIVVDLPSNPAPGTRYSGTLESVGDRFEVVLNEQEVSGNSITVRALHMRLLGPTAVGDLFVGESRCSLSATTTGGGSGAAGTGGAGGGGLASTGNEAVLFTLLGIDLVLVGIMVARGAARRRMARVDPFPSAWR